MAFFNLTDLPGKEIIPGYQARSLHTGNITLIYWSVEEGAAMPTHTHIHEQVAHVLKGKFELVVDGVSQILEPGMIAYIPPNIPHGGKALSFCELLDVFHPEREDYKFT